MIKIDSLKRSGAEDRSIDNGYLYKDIKFDLDLQKNTRNELYSAAKPQDISSLEDARAIINSVKNILTTTPGQKLLNPRFGLDLRSYLFESISNVTSFFIVEDVYESLGLQEPRINLQTVAVTGYPDRSEYSINITLSIPTLEIFDLNLKATLNRDGYVVI